MVPGIIACYRDGPERYMRMHVGVCMAKCGKSHICEQYQEWRALWSD